MTCSHEIKRHLLLGRKVMANVESIFKSRNITLLTKVHITKLWFFPAVTLDHKEGWVLENWCFQIVVLENTLESPLNCIPSVQSLSHVQLCDPMGYGTPGFPVHHQLPELAQIHVHPVGDAIQSSHPLSPLSPAFNLSQHQGFFFFFQ